MLFKQNKRKTVTHWKKFNGKSSQKVANSKPNIRLKILHVIQCIIKKTSTQNALDLFVISWWPWLLYTSTSRAWVEQKNYLADMCIEHNSSITVSAKRFFLESPLCTKNRSQHSNFNSLVGLIRNKSLASWSPEF